MPNWSDNNGRYWWVPPGKPWYSSIEIDHPPVLVVKGCKCAFCSFYKKKK